MYKYLKYAIGEIILVVIGILIALYLNNQQEAYTSQKEQEIYVFQLVGFFHKSLSFESLKPKYSKKSFSIIHEY